MRTIGFVCEGPTDVELLSAVTEHILQDRITPLFLQPEASLQGNLGNGWKGVWKWCKKHGGILDCYTQDATPKIDLMIIQMDGDVSRKERETHCLCVREICPAAGTVFPLECQEQNCPVILPCDKHRHGAEGYSTHLTEMIQNLIKAKIAPVCVIPCDSTDAWIVAAYEDLGAVENIIDPWDTIISRSKDYHGIRIPGHKKNLTIYRSFLPTVCKNWSKVTQTCTQAHAFEAAIRNSLT